MWTFLFRSRYSWLLGWPTGLVGVFLVFGPGIGSLGGGSSNAWAGAAPSPTVSPQRVRELEERVKILELEYETLDRRMRLQAEQAGRALEELDMRVHALEGAARAAEGTPPPKESISLEEVCKDPYIRFANGIRRVKEGCEDRGRSCDVPEVVDARGVWTVRPECVPATPVKAGNCDITYSIGDNGIKQFKPECM